MSKSNLQQLEDHDEDIFTTTIQDQYAACPHAFKDITLAEFATLYTTGYGEDADSTETPDINLDNESITHKGR